MKWNRFNLLSPAGERRGQPLTDIAVEVVVVVVVLGCRRKEEGSQYLSPHW